MVLTDVFQGSVAIRFGSTDTFDNVIIIHPGQTNIEQIKAIKVPSLWLCAEGELTAIEAIVINSPFITYLEDMSFGPKIRHEAEAVFAARRDKPEFIEYEFKDFKGRPNLSERTTN